MSGQVSLMQGFNPLADKGSRRVFAAFGTSVVIHLCVLFLLSFAGKAAPPHRSVAMQVVLAAGTQASSPPDDRLEGATRDPISRTGEPSSGQQAAPQDRGGSNLVSMPAPPVFFRSDQLTKQSEPLTQPELDAPQIDSLIAEGRMVLEVWIDSQGQAVEAFVVSSELPEAFNRVAVSAFLATRYIPGERAGQKVGSIVRIEVKYEDPRAETP